MQIAFSLGSVSYRWVVVHDRGTMQADLTSLMLAASKGHTDTVTALLANGAELEARVQVTPLTGKQNCSTMDKNTDFLVSFGEERPPIACCSN